MEAKEYYTLDEVKDKFIGKVGSPARDEYEADIEAHLIGASLKEARKSISLTQKELWEMTKIENEAQYDWAVQRVEELLPLLDDNTPETDKNYIELVLLSNLVADYSDEHYAIGEPSLIDMLKLRMYEMGLTQVALAKILGINPSRISEYLSGKKEPTLSQARVIVERLNIDPATVLGVSYAG